MLNSKFLIHRIRTSEILRWDRKSFLAHRIGISNILFWHRNSSLTHVILPRMSCEGCTLVVLELPRVVVNGHHCYIKVTSSCIQGLLAAFL